jgi:hypothetical protein
MALACFMPRAYDGFCSVQMLRERICALHKTLSQETEARTQLQQQLLLLGHVESGKTGRACASESHQQ